MASDVQGGGAGGYRIPVTRRKRSASKKRPPAALFGPISRADAPITRARSQAHAQVQRAERKLPARRQPAIPLLRHPTRRQTQAAVDLSRRSFQAQAPRNQSPRARQQQLAGISHELLTDPRTRRGARVNASYGRQQTEQLMLELARGVGAHGGTRAQRIRVGQQILAQHLAMNPAAHEGRPATVLRAGFLPDINLTAIGRSLKAATTLERGDIGPGRLVSRSLADVKSIGEFPVLGGYQVGLGLYDAARHGDPGRLERLGRGIVEGTVHDVRHPGQAFTEHPLLSALNVLGAASVVGRTVGAVGRAGGAASTVRAPLALTDDAGAASSGLLHERTFSRDAGRRELQKMADARREPLLHPDGTPVVVHDRGQARPVLKATPAERERLLRRRGDFSAARANSVERLVREQAGKSGRTRVRGQDAKRLVAMAVEGTLTGPKHFVEDLRSHARRLEEEYQRRVQADPKGYRHSEEAAANRSRLEFVQRVLASPKLTARGEQIIEHAVGHGARLTAADRELVARKVLTAERGHRSRLIPVAVEHMGARHFTVEEHRALERRALEREQQARAAIGGATGPEKAKAVALYRQARAERIAVSGRHPEKVVAYETAQAGVVRAEQAVRKAQAEHVQAHNALTRLGGVQSVRRGGEAARRMAAGSRGGTRAQNVVRYISEAEGDAGRLQKGAAMERRLSRDRAAAEARVRKAKLARQRAEKELRRAKHRLRENPLPEARAGVRTAEGKFLSNRDIEEFLRSRGRDPESVAYLPHRLDVVGSRAFHTQFRPGGRPVLDKETRTGEAYRKGATESTPELLQQQGVRQATQLAKAEQLDAFVTEHGLRHPAWSKAKAGRQLSKAEKRIVDRGGYFTGPEAQELIDRLGRDTGEEWQAVSAFQGKLSAETQRVIREELQGPGAMESLSQRLLNDRIVSPEELGQTRTRNIVLVPKTLTERLEGHLRPAGELQKLLQMVNRPFRMAVLTQPRWLTGNFVEPYFVRLPTIGSGAINVPGLALDIRAANKALAIMERSGNPRLAQLAKEVRAQQFGGLFIGGRGASNRRSRDQFATYGRVVAKVPAVETFADAASTALRIGLTPLEQYFRVNRKLIEAPAQKAAFGRMLRHDIQEFRGSWVETLKLGDQAVQEAVKGLVGTPTQERFMRNQHELLGKYEGYSPVLREAIQGLLPFLPWALSAARFVFWTMPVHRTAQTALLIRTQDVVAKEWTDEHKDAPPGSLRLAARTKEGGYVDFSRYTPYGLTGPALEGDLQGLTDQFAPQGSGFIAGIEGKDPFGRDLQVPKDAGHPQGKATAGQKVGSAFYTLAEALIPYLSTVRRLREHGETPYATSTALSPKTKPGTSHGISAARRTFDPFRPVFLRQGAASSGGSVPQALLREARREAVGAHVSDQERRALLREARAAAGR